MKPPLNELERAYIAFRGPESYPELFRLLRESTLIFLLPHHPELEDATMGVGNGDPVPPFIVWKSDADGAKIPIFTSVERANDACIKSGGRENQYALCEMNGRELFELLSCQQHGIAINPATDLMATFFDLRGIKKLADGSILEPIKEGAKENGRVKIVDPADYPTDFLQPLFRFLRERKEVKAAWLFRQLTTPEPDRISYVFVFKVTGNGEEVKQLFSVVADRARPGNVDFGVTLLDESNPVLVNITSKHAAFYAAPDYQSPSPL